MRVESVADSFPIHDGMRPYESGQGYVLRMAAANRLLGLHQIKAMLGKSRFAVLDGDDAPALGQLFSADESALRFALGRLLTGEGTGNYEYAGGPIGRSYFVNRMYPRTCPECVREHGQCDLPWDVSLVVACERHKVLLTDHCRHCGRQLSWNRSALDVCGCGNWIEASPNAGIPRDVEIQFAHWVRSCVTRRIGVTEKPVRSADSALPLMTLIRPLSLDGGLRVVYALGTAATYDKGKGDNATINCRPRAAMSKARHVLASAAKLAEKIVRLDRVEFRITRPTAVIGLLAESMSAQDSPQDRSLAYSILYEVLKQKSVSSWRGTFPQLSQMNLF
jgi:hypothetical protein